ncbi:MAG: alpha-amylase family glycosyl hydrolase [Gemmatimonadaceae bacterium]
MSKLNTDPAPRPWPIFAALFCIHLWSANVLGGQLTMRLISIPSTTPPGAVIHVAGTFNRWDPASSEYVLVRQPDGSYSLTLPNSVRGPIEFKFTLGSWETVELTASGEGVPNRTLVVPRTGQATFTGSVGKWQTAASLAPRPSTASHSVSILSDSFAMPQLGRKRRVWLYLPPDYATTTKRYPVLYMQDGQNVFDAATSFAGEWGVDETLDSLHARGDRGAIVVAVDHGGTHRLDEYNPWRASDPKNGGGEGDAYLDFLVHTLKPYIDQHYRTQSDRLHTAIMGSSMGGLISLYAALKYPSVFGRAGVFSCACWVVRSQIFSYARRAKPLLPLPKIYFVAGGLETSDGEQTRDQRHMVTTLASAGFPIGRALRARAPADGKHSEWFWRREFPAAYQWLFAGDAEGGSRPDSLTSEIRTYKGASSLASWTRGATCYEIFLRSFKDSNGDGIGDINGLISKLDYINDGDPRSTRDLGARCIWLMPVAASPSYHGYDVSDYYSVNRDYGTNDDFKRLITAAHKRGIKVLVDMVLNHASSQHPYFVAALHDTASAYRNWFRWSPTRPTELNPWGYSNWHKSPVREEWYYGFFSSQMPDLNYTYSPVREEAKKVAAFWLNDMGVDGFRLDAVPYLVEEGKQIHHTAGTHAVLRDYAAYVRSVKPQSFTIGEVSDSTKEMLGYYPDQLDAYFAFEVADSIISAVRRGSAKGLLAPVVRLQREVPFGRWSPFLSNHDQPRTATRLQSDASRLAVASFLLLTMPGIPFVYYGEEIGMTGPKPDERIRTPMQWSGGHADGFSSSTPWEPLQPDSLSVTVASQDARPSSLLNQYRRLIHLRDNNAPLATGVLIPLTASNDAVAAYLRRDGNRTVLVLANLGETPLHDVSVSGVGKVLNAGRFTLRSLFGDASAAPLRVGPNGEIAGYIPVRTLAPMKGYVFELVTTSGNGAR